MHLLLVLAILGGFVFVMSNHSAGGGGGTSSVSTSGATAPPLGHLLPDLGRELAHSIGIKSADDGQIRNSGLTRTPDGAAVQMASSPDGSAEALVLDVIDNAHTELDVAAYEFTNRRIAEHLIEKATREHVRVQIVMDRSQLTERRSRIAELAAAGIRVRIDMAVPLMHDKLIIADRENTETGSMNFTQAGAHANAENVIVVWHHPGNAGQARLIWTRLWNEAQPYETLAANGATDDAPNDAPNRRSPHRSVEQETP